MSMSLGESGLFALDELEGFLERAHFRRVPYSQVVLSTVLVFAMAASRRSVQIGRKLREVRPMRTMSAHGRRYKSGLDLMEAADVLAVTGGSHILKSLVDVIDSTTVLRAEARWEVKGIFISTFSAVIRQAMSVRPLRAITNLQVVKELLSEGLEVVEKGDLVVFAFDKGKGGKVLVLIG